MNSKNMRKKIALGTLTAMLVMGSGVASADSSNWDRAFWRIIMGNRCTNAGPGNGGERFRRGECRDIGRGEAAGRDRDPGNSGDNNRAPGKPPGR